MPTVKVRKQGSAAVVTIPVATLKALDIGIGCSLKLSVVDREIHLRAAGLPIRKRYTLDELLKGYSPAKARRIRRETAWLDRIPAVGREID